MRYTIKTTDYHNGFYAVFDEKDNQISEEFGYYSDAEKYIHQLEDGLIGGKKYPNITKLYTYPEAKEENLEQLEIYIFVVRDENIIVWQGVMWYAEGIEGLQPMLDRFKVVECNNPTIIDACIDNVIAQWIIYKQEDLDRLKELIGLENGST